MGAGEGEMFNYYYRLSHIFLHDRSSQTDFRKKNMLK